MKELGVDSVLFEVKEFEHETIMLQVLFPGEVAWRNLQVIKHSCRVPIQIRGAQYIFRLVDAMDLSVFPGTLIKVLTPPATPITLGVGRNICVCLDVSCRTQGASDIISAYPGEEISTLKYVVSWWRARDRCNTKTEPEGSMELQKREFRGITGSPLVLLVAFPRLGRNSDYQITVRTIISYKSCDKYAQVVQSSESPAASWCTGLGPLAPCVANKNSWILQPPRVVDVDNMLVKFGLRAECFIEGSDEGMVSFQRLREQDGNTVFQSGEKIALSGTPAYCSIRISCAMDLRALGASHLFWDRTPVLEVQTLPSPEFSGMVAFKNSMQLSSLIVSWPPQHVRAMYMEPPKPPSYYMQAYSPKTGSYIPIASTFASSMNICAIDCFDANLPAIEPGVCLCIRLLRSACDLTPDKATPNQTMVVVLAPLPPVISLVSKSPELVRVSWDGSLDVSNIPFSNRPLVPSKIVLEAASTPLVSPIHTEQECGYRLSGSVKSPRGSIFKPNSIFSATDFHPIIAVSRTSSVTVRLAPGQQYHFRLCLAAVHGASTSSTVNIRTKPTVPSAPKTPTGTIAYFVSTTGHRAPFVRLSWETPRSYGVPVCRYLVQACRARGANEREWGRWNTIYTGPQATCGDDLTLNKHEVFAMYRVKAGCALGWGAYSPVLTIAAPDGIESWQKSNSDVYMNYSNVGCERVNFEEHMKLAQTPLSSTCHKRDMSLSTDLHHSLANAHEKPRSDAAKINFCVSWPSENLSKVSSSTCELPPVRARTIARELTGRLKNALGYSVANGVLGAAVSELTARIAAL